MNTITTEELYRLCKSHEALSTITYSDLLKTLQRARQVNPPPALGLSRCVVDGVGYPNYTILKQYAVFMITYLDRRYLVKLINLLSECEEEDQAPLTDVNFDSILRKMGVVSTPLTKDIVADLGIISAVRSDVESAIYYIELSSMRDLGKGWISYSDLLDHFSEALNTDIDKDSLNSALQDVGLMTKGGMPSKRAPEVIQKTQYGIAVNLENLSPFINSLFEYLLAQRNMEIISDE